MGDTIVEKNNIEPLEKKKCAEVKKKPDKKITNKIIQECKSLIENNKNIKRQDVRQIKGRPFSPKSSLDKVAQDIKNILGQLKQIPTVPKKQSAPVELKIVQKEFFKEETSKKTKTNKQNLPNKQNTQSTKGKGSSSTVNKLSRNSIRTGSINKIKSGTFIKPGSLNTIHSNSLFRKVPITKSELQNFKHKIAMSANEVLKFPEKLKHIDKEKVAKQVKTLMEAALVESEHTHKVPVIDVGSFINKSLKLASSNDFPELKKIVERKTPKLSNYETGSESEWSENGKEKEKIESNDEKECREEKKKEKKNSPAYKDTKSEKNLIASSQNNKTVNRKRSDDSSKNKITTLIHPVVQTLRTIPNHGYTSRTIPKSNSVSHQSKTTGNLILRQKSPAVNTNQNSQKAVPKTNSKHVSNNKPAAANKPVVSKQNPADKTQVGGATKVLNPPKTNSVGSKPSSANSNAVVPKHSGAVGRRDSLSAGSNRRLMATPIRTFSSVSSKLLSGRRYSHFGNGASSHSYFEGVRTASSGTRRHVDPMMQLRDEVNRAIRDKKTFTVRGNFPAVRRALLKRGWVEKYHITNRERLQHEVNSLKNRSINELVDKMREKDMNEICRKLIKSKLLGSHQVDFYWGPNFESFQINSDKVKFTKINKFRRDVFSYTSKQGLSDAAKNAHWFNFPGLAHIKHPRTYALAKNGETKDFIKDFRHTAAMSLLKWVMKSHQTKECKIISNSGRIPLEAFQFAANECYKMLVEATNQDIDHPLNEAHDHEWNQFLEYYYKILHIGNHFKAGSLETEESIVEKSTYLIEKLIPHCPYIKMDGTMNIWILKPAAGSQGRGIHICRTLQYILQTVANKNNIKYIAQKYIERPLLIFNTKFDIRQWFLISSSSPLTIWMYKECYLRFSSQTYNLRKLHESIHLTNNSVQKRYQSTSHDITLPHYNMWDSTQFRHYLSNIGYPDIYRKVIYKGMKECFIGAVMIHQDKIDKRKNCFELYGADFMLTEDFTPWLIEINSSPALFASTPITSRMCPQVLEDVIKVVVDHAADPKAKTGNFELIYRQPNLPCNNNANVSNLKVSGKPLSRNYFCLDEDKASKQIKSLSITENLQIERKISRSKSEVIAKGVKETLENLLKFIQNEKKKRQNKRMATRGTDPIDAKIEDKRSSCTCTSTSLSFTSLKSQLDILSTCGDISMSKEEENMIDQALKMLKNKKNNEVVKYLIGIVERIVTKIPQKR